MSEEIDREIWKNATKSRIYVRVQDPYNPQQVNTKLILPGDTIVLSSKERAMNQQSFPRKENDFFDNGVLEPVRLIEDAVDYAAITESPNLKSESEIKELLVLPVAKLKKELAEITSPILLKRIAVVAKEDDGLTAGRLNAVLARETEVCSVEDNHIGYENEDAIGRVIPKERFLV